jgi:DNA polymerase III epsilon subunit-like protein
MSIGAVAFSLDGQLVGHPLEVFSNSGKYIPPKVQELTKITLAVLASKGVTPSAALQTLHDWLAAFGRPIILVGHNMRNFDFKFLRHESDHLGVPLFPCWAVLDTLKLCRATPAFKGKSLKLADLLRQTCSKEIVDAHTALADAMALKDVVCSSVFQNLCPTWYNSGQAWDVCVAPLL